MHPIRKDFEVAAYAAAIYDYAGLAPAKWDYFETETLESPVCLGLKYLEGDTIITLRGSVTAEDWFANLAAWPVEHPDLGMVHPGFCDGIAAVWRRVKPRIKGRLYITGHSRGAAQAALLTAIAVLDNIRPARVVLLGCPRPGGAKLAKILDGASIASYRAVTQFEKDPICDVPFDIMPAAAYVQPVPLRDLPVIVTNAARQDMGLMFAIHFAPDYVAALQNKGF